MININCCGIMKVESKWIYLDYFIMMYHNVSCKSCKSCKTWKHVYEPSLTPCREESRFCSSQDPSRHPFGGSNTSRTISLQPAICQIVSQCLRLGHPRSRSLLATYNSLYANVRRLDGKSFYLGNLYGSLVSKKTTNQVISLDFFLQQCPLTR